MSIWPLFCWYTDHGDHGIHPHILLRKQRPHSLAFPQRYLGCSHKMSYAFQRALSAPLIFGLWKSINSPLESGRKLGHAAKWLDFFFAKYWDFKWFNHWFCQTYAETTSVFRDMMLSSREADIFFGLFHALCPSEPALMLRLFHGRNNVCHILQILHGRQWQQWHWYQICFRFIQHLQKASVQKQRS